MRCSSAAGPRTRGRSWRGGRGAREGTRSRCACFPLSHSLSLSRLVRAQKSPNSLLDVLAPQNAELSYVYHRLALVALSQTDFARAFDLLLLAGCDPRVVVRLFADLREGALMRGERDAVWVPRGVEDEVRGGKGVDEYSASFSLSSSPSSALYIVLDPKR